MRGFDISNRRFLQGLNQRALFEAYNGAMDFVNEGFGGLKAAVKSGEFPGIDHQALTRRLNGTVVIPAVCYLLRRKGSLHSMREPAERT